MAQSKEMLLGLAHCQAMGMPICETEEETSSLIEIVKFRNIEPPQRAITLRCDCIVQDDERSESKETEQEEQSASVKEELLLENIKDEVEQKKAAVDRIARMLSMELPECPWVDACVDNQVELANGDVHPTILELQRNNHKLSQQLRDLQLSCKAADLSLKHLRKGLCRDLEAGMILQRRLNELDSFRRTMEFEQGLCRQRYRHLQEEKYEWDSCHAHISKQHTQAQRDVQKYVPRVAYPQHKKDALKLLDQSKLHAKQLHTFLTDSMNSLTQRLTLSKSLRSASEMGLALRSGSVIAAFLKRNEHLFAAPSAH